MISKCPGEDNRNLRMEMLKCPDCGYKVEFFSDEVKRKCPKCKSLVFRQRLPSCVDWCKVVRECMGEEEYRRLKGI